MTNADRSVLPLAAEPQVPMVHQKVGAMILRGDRIRIRFGHALMNFRRGYIHLIAAWSTRLGAYSAGDGKRGFLRKSFQRLKRLLVQIILDRNALDDTGPVTQQRENDFAGFAEIVKPAGNSHGFARVPTGFGDSDSVVFCRFHAGQIVSSLSKISFALSNGFGHSGTSFNSSNSGY